jgi:hypothetical protein
MGNAYGAMELSPDAYAAKPIEVEQCGSRMVLIASAASKGRLVLAGLVHVPQSFA